MSSSNLAWGFGIDSIIALAYKFIDLFYSIAIKFLYLFS